jgi:hypothetical protein
VFIGNEAQVEIESCVQIGVKNGDYDDMANSAATIQVYLADPKVDDKSR